MSDIDARIRSQIGDDDKEAWRPDHDSAMQYYDFEDFLRSGMKLYRELRDEDDAWSRKVQDGTIAFDAEIAKYFRNRYETWFEPCELALQYVQYFEKEYGMMPDGEKFKRARLLVKTILAIPIERVIASMKQIADGGYELV